MGEGRRETALHRAACTECQRRKQKCNREWPCNHCQKRKVADRCRFGSSQPTSDKATSHESSRKRQLDQDDTDSIDSNPWEDADSGLEALGYSASHLFAGLGSSSTRKPKSGPKTYRQYYMEPAICPQLRRAIQTLPPRPYTDALVQNFLNHVNFHYYIIYPPSFLEEYRTWWSLRSESRPLGLQWTCLLLMVCACSTQYANAELQRKMEMDLGENMQNLTERYHNAARELHSAIPVGNSHLLNVQSLLHSCYWYKSEARFVECWHVLSAAIREAQALGIHKESVTGLTSEFDREMRRRIWCVLDTWDWQISALLARPLLIDRTDIDVGLPSLTLEGYTPSPLLHMKLQSELIKQLFNRFGNSRNVVRPGEVQAYQAIVERWMNAFPSTYALTAPYTSSDLSRPWIVLHRHYLRSMALSMMLDPIRAYLAKPLSRRSPPEELKIRNDGIDYSLRLMDALYSFFDHVYPRDAKFHFVLFCIFDTAAVLCSALMHDADSSLARRSDVLAAIDKAVAMLKRLNTVTKTARTSYEVLVKITRNINRPTQEAQLPFQSAVKESKADDFGATMPSLGQGEAAMSSGPGSVESHISTPPHDTHFHQTAVSHLTPPGLVANSDELAIYAPPVTSAPGVMVPQLYPIHYDSGQLNYSSSYVNMTPPTDDFYQAVNPGNSFGAITERELGDLATLWNYESLNLNFINPGGAS